MKETEDLIYSYIVERNAFYGLVKIKAQCTRDILLSYADEERDRLIEKEPRVWEFIYTEIGLSPLLEKSERYSLFTLVLNDMYSFVQNCCIPCGSWPNPLKGKGVVITYHEFETQLRISQDIVKLRVKNLIDKDKISARRGMGGYEYTPLIQDIKDKMLESPGKWSPMTFNPEIMNYEEDPYIIHVIDAAQKTREDFQGYYEKVLKNICEQNE